MQARVDAWIQANGGYWEPLALLARLTEEVGELSRELNHRHGSKRKKDSEAERALRDELGDVLFILTCIANQAEVDLGDALEGAVSKYEARDGGRW
ncbi:MAG: nucleotide pyrophosphohydrolase [Deltaproteobacteria bacterium]|nr:nucleotide pyrophosphohydrolase [Deltaproteobacteria bacterium]